MEHHKQPSSTDPHRTQDPLAAHASPQWKGKVLAAIFFLIVLSGVWSTGIIQDAMAGPNIPLPRQDAEFSLGMTKSQIMEKYPKLKKRLRKYNDDKVFRIAKLDAADGITGPASVELLFYKDQLYYVSAMWDGDGAKNLPLPEWAKQYRRWNRNSRGVSEPLGDNVYLREWFFGDAQTEMVLRDLNYTDHVQRWQDLRDASNAEAQAAFAKYRLDPTS